MASDTSLCSSFALVAPCFAVEYEVLRNSRRSFFLRLSVLVILSLLCFASNLVIATLDAVPIILRKIVSWQNELFGFYQTSVKQW
jgi:hypothetical protein